MDGGAITFAISILMVAVLVFMMILWTGKKGGRHLNVEAYQTKFLSIENSLNKTNPATFITSIINADKLLDQALTELGVPGSNLGERLKSSAARFSNLNAVWGAHKLRNALVHEPDINVSYRQAVAALRVYKKALKDLGAI